MSTQATEATGVTASKPSSPLPLAKLSSAPALAVMVFAFAAALTLFYRPFGQLEAGDPAIYDYIAQSILRGQLPYRDTVDIKGPASVYLSAAAIAAGRLVGLQDVTAVRLAHILMVGWLAALTFRVGVVYMRSRLIGVTAAMLPFVSPTVIEMFIGGTQPKLPLVIFGLASLLLTAADRPFWAGLCGMLACLCWQPGLMFVGTVFLIFSRYLTSWRDRRAARVLVGAALPLAVAVLYLYARGALGDMWSYAMVYNYTVFGPEARKPLVEAGAHLWQIVRRAFGSRAIFLVIALGGLALYVAERAAAKFKRGLSSEDFLDAVAWPPLVYLAFAFINFQAEPDLIPFMPFAGLFAAWAVAAAGRRVAERAPARVAGYPARIDQLVLAATLAVILALAARAALTYRLDGETLQQQTEEVNAIAARLQPEDKVYAHGAIGMLVLMNRPNLNPYVFLDWDMDTFIAARKYGGSFQALIDEMEAARPQVVGLTRLRAVTHGAELEQWVRAHYQELPLRVNKGVYVRRED